MDMLKLAIKARLPFIHVKTDDVLYVQQVLSFIADEQVKPFQSGEDPAKAELTEGDVFFTNMDAFPQKLYLNLKAKNKTLIFVNTKTSVLHFVGGTMLPPKEMILMELKKHCPDELAEEILSAFGGMTLKDTYEIVRLVLEKDSKLTTKGVNKVRQSYVAKLKGISQVDADYSFYDVPSYLKNWTEENLDFFKNPVHESLTPRGLLFDGPPGTGKTMGGKYLAQQLGMPLYRLDIGAMKGKYVGDSEGNLNAALTQIDLAAPCVVIFDEVEKIFAGGTNDQGVTSSLLSTLLWWLQEHKSKVFTVMTTNKASAIPKELYREGRIDRTMVFQGLETYQQAHDFAQQVLGFLQVDLGKFSKPEMDVLRKNIANRLEQEFVDGNAVPQVKVNQIVNDAAKPVLAARKEKK